MAQDYNVNSPNPIRRPRRPIHFDAHTIPPRVFLIEDARESRERRIATADLNRWLQDVSEKHPPSMASKGASRRPNKLFYASQVAVRPPTIVVFCTDPQAIQTSYVRFLENQLRDSFGFEGAPLRVKLRRRSSKRRE